MSLAHINMNQPRVRGVCPLILSRALSPASPPRPPGCPRAPALGARVERCTCAGHLFPVPSHGLHCRSLTPPTLALSEAKGLLFTSVPLLPPCI